MKLRKDGYYHASLVVFYIVMVAIICFSLGFILAKEFYSEQKVDAISQIEQQDILDYLGTNSNVSYNPEVWYIEHLVSEYSEPILHNLLHAFYDELSFGEISDLIEVDLVDVATVTLEIENSGSIRYRISFYNSVKQSFSESLMLYILLDQYKTI